VLVPIPDKGQVTTRYYGWYANRPRGMRGQAAPAGADAPVPMVVTPTRASTEATRRWAALFVCDNDWPKAPSSREVDGECHGQRQNAGQGQQSLIGVNRHPQRDT